MGRLILDTSVLVAVERGSVSLDELIGDDDDVSIAAITASELWLGVELADAHHRPIRTTFVEQVIASIPVEDFDLRVARTHADLLVHTRREGRPRSAHDLLIAATALTRGRAVVTLDGSGFAGLPGLDVIAPVG